jgi:hypothetical protein
MTVPASMPSTAVIIVPIASPYQTSRGIVMNRATKKVGIQTLSSTMPLIPLKT